MHNYITPVPNTWRDLQKQVAVILQDCGFAVEVEKDVETVRGVVEVDVYAEDPEQRPKALYLCECKHWSTRVPKTVVHAFRTVVSDHGANWGLVISSAGFQKGAAAAAANSNIRLITWEDFQSLFVDRWIERYMTVRIRAEADALTEYTEPINSRIFRKADKLSPEAQKSFGQLREKHLILAAFALPFYARMALSHRNLPTLPLRANATTANNRDFDLLPDDVLDAAFLREFVEAFCRRAREATLEFDDLFGERA